MERTLNHRGYEFALGDEVRIVVQPGDEVYEGFLNVIEFPQYIVLVSTGVHIQGFEDRGLAFPLSSITRMDLI